MTRSAGGATGPRRDPGLERGAPLTIRVNGRPCIAYRGESVLAALLASGLVAIRRSHLRREPRGPLCGMGVCYECLVTIDGVPNRRACMHEVADGMEVTTDG